MTYHAVYSAGKLVYEVENDRVILDLRDSVREAGYFIQADIQPYRSQLTGEMVQSRSRHRDLLREHRCIEVGNETKYLRAKEVKPVPGLKQRLIEVVNSKL